MKIPPHMNNVLLLCPTARRSPSPSCSFRIRRAVLLSLFLCFFLSLGLIFFKDTNVISYTVSSSTTKKNDPKAPPSGQAPLSIEKRNQLHALEVLQGKWIFLLGDSSIRMFNAATISRLNGTLEDPRFGRYRMEVPDKGNCTRESNAGKSGCLREYIDMENKIRLTYSFKTYLSQEATTMENLISPSQQPDVILLGTGAWDGSSNTMSGTEAGSATIALVRKMMDLYPSTDFVLATLVSCDRGWQRYAFAYNAEIRRRIPALDHQGRLQLLDREPSTRDARSRGSCEGWHAYGNIVLGHVDEFLNLVEFKFSNNQHQEGIN